MILSIMVLLLVLYHTFIRLLCHGKTVYDIGSDPDFGSDLGPSYGMEIFELFCG